jgi:hypothetical protein
MFRKSTSRRPMRTAKINKVAMTTNKICKAFEEEAEEILEDAEEAVKEFFPARKVKASLKKLETRLAEEGIKAAFDYKISRATLNKTATIEVTEEELEEALNAIVDATVGEFEDLLADTEEYVDEAVDVDSDDEVKTTVESKLADMGVTCKLARRAKAKKSARRTASKTSKVTKRPNPILSKMRG